MTDNTDMDDYNKKWHLVQPSRDMPIDDEYEEDMTPDEIERIKALEDEEEAYTRMILSKKPAVEFTFNTNVKTKKNKEPKELKETVKKTIIEIPKKVEPKVRCFNPRLPPPDKYKITGYNKTFKLNSTEFPSL